MLNRETFHTDPTEYRLANQGVAKTSFPPTPADFETLRGELTTFVCDGAYADGLARMLEAFLGSVGHGSSAPAVWISGFYGSGKSHLASMLAALWTNLEFPDGATAEGLVHHLPPEVTAPLKELRIAAQRASGVVAAGDTLGTGPSDPVEATIGIVLRAIGLPSDLRAAAGGVLAGRSRHPGQCSCVARQHFRHRHSQLHSVSPLRCRGSGGQTRTGWLVNRIERPAPLAIP